MHFHFIPLHSGSLVDFTITPKRQLPDYSNRIPLLLNVCYILQSETAIVEVVCDVVNMRGAVQNKVIGDWIISNQSEYQS